MPADGARAAPAGAAPSPAADQVARLADKYFLKTKDTVGRFGDVDVTYAVFMRRPVICTPRLAVAWLEAMAAARGVAFDIRLRYPEGAWVGAGEPLMMLSGPLYHLVDLETIYLQKLGPACVAAYNAYQMCVDLPNVSFLAMDARHCAGQEMADMMAYAASVGSTAAKRDSGARGFIGNATDATAHHFGNAQGMGTMPHALIGYAGSTVRAAEMYHEAFPDEPMTVLVDYFAQEVTDALAVCRRFPEMAAAGRLSFRLDTHGGRYVEGWTSTAPMPSSTGAPRARSRATARRRNCGISSAPASRPRPSGTSGSSSTRPGSRRPASWPARDSPRPNARRWRSPRCRST